MRFLLFVHSIISHYVSRLKHFDARRPFPCQGARNDKQKPVPCCEALHLGFWASLYARIRCPFVSSVPVPIHDDRRS